jgi:hypothetical protein
MNITGAKWSREILSRVLIEAYDNGDLPIHEALAAADGILGRHALDFYKLEGRGGFSASTDNLQRLQSFSGTNLVSLDRSQSFTPRLPPSIQDSPKANKETNGFNAVFQKETMRVEGEQKGTSAETMAVKHVRLLYADGSGQRRCRVIPIGRYAEVSMDYGVGLTQACMGMTSFSDAPAPNSGVTNVGEIRLMPDASTKHRLPWYNFFLCCPGLLRVFVIGIW